MLSSALHEKGRIDTQVADHRVPDLLDRRVEDALRRDRGIEPAACHQFALELTRSPSGVAEAAPVRFRIARQQNRTEEPALQITLYKRTYRVKGAPVSLSLNPFSTEQVHTFSAGGQVYEARYSEVRVTAPDEAKLDVLHNRLVWGKGMGTVKATAKEVYELAAAGKSGFGLVK